VRRGVGAPHQFRLVGPSTRLPAGVLFVRVVKSRSDVGFAVELRFGLFVSHVGSGFKNFRREGDFKNNFS